MRKTFAKIHLWLSIPLGVIISIICFTGAILVFEKEITQWVAPDLNRQEVRTSDEDRKPSASRTTAYAPNQKSMLAEHGKMPEMKQSKGRPKSLPFFREVKKLHRWLLNPPAKKGEKSVGKVIVGVTTLLMVFILISGLVIWIPRTARSLKNRLKVSCSKGSRRFWYDTHVALGFYATLFLILMALTGLTWSFGWFREMAYGLFGGDPSLKATFYALHTGSWGGITTKILYFIASLIGGMLPLTGYYLWWKRTHPKKQG